MTAPLHETAGAHPAMHLNIEFCGEEYLLAPGDTLSAGRDADLVVDDNPYLHRRMVEFRHDQGFWWIGNVGSRLSVTVSGGAGTLQSWIAPGMRVPMVLPRASVLFTAGDTSYELDVRCGAPTFESVPDSAGDSSAEATLGAVDLTPSQFQMVLALAEATLRRNGTGASEIATNARVANRLGWSITTFNRKLDNVCDKFARAGVRGLQGGSGALARNRRARLVEYVVAARIVRPEHLPLLDSQDPRR